MGMTQAVILPNEESRGEKPHHYRILVVDDNENCAKVMMWTLEMMGHTLQMALDGPTAIGLAKSFHPEIVILDIGIPGMNGYEICQTMRMEPVLINTTFIALTGWGEKEHMKRSKEAGFDYHLVKPLDMEALKNILLVQDKDMDKNATPNRK